MTREVHICPFLSGGYAGVGTAASHNLARITMLLFPEGDLLSTRDHPRPALYTRSATR
jgi:hypothetical protein